MEAKEEGRIDYDEAKNTALAYLVFAPTSTHVTSFFTCDATTSTHVFTKV